MPYIIRHVGECFKVVNTETGRVHAKCATLENAKKQIRFLMGLEHGLVSKRI